MEYITTRQAAEAWGIQKRAVQKYCRVGRISGAAKVSGVWMVPSGAQRPAHEYKEGLPTNPAPRGGVLLMTGIYRVPGSGGALAEYCRRNDPGTGEVMEMNLAYFRGDHEKSAAMARKLLSSKCGMDTRLNCCHFISMDAMYNGDTKTWREARGILLRTKYESAQEYALYEFNVAIMDCNIFDKNSFPAWFTEGRFERLPLEAHPLARFIYLKWLYMNRDVRGLAAAAGPLISQSHVEGALLSEIYLRIIAAAGYQLAGGYAQAEEHIKKALELALPDGLYSPFAEYRRQLGAQLDKIVRESDPFALREIIRLNHQIQAGWTKLYNSIYNKNITNELTLREYETAKYVCLGMANAEIASRMGISVNAVKLYLHAIYEKLGVSGRTKIAPFIWEEP